MENLEKNAVNQANEAKNGEKLNFTEREIARVLMESPDYKNLSPEQQIALIKRVEADYPELAKYFNSEYADA